MTLDVVNNQNEKVGSLDLRDEVFGGRVRTDLIWESVVHERRPRPRDARHEDPGLVSGSGKKPWRQKGTGRARVGECATRSGARAARCSARSRAATTTALPRKVERGALRAALASKLATARWWSSTRWRGEIKTKAAAEMLRRLGADGKTLLVDVAPDEKFALSVRNLAGRAPGAEPTG
jgi:large subunit ribosomal protein L4